MRPALLLCAALCACTPDFASRSDVTDLRVLAVQAEPPEALVDAAAVEDVVVTVLAVDPSRSSFRLAFDLCAPTDSRRCDSDPVYASGTRGPQPSGLFQVRFSVPASAVQSALASDKLGGFGGIRVQFSFSVDDGDPRGPAHASKILLYSRRSSGAPNHNPTLEGVKLTRDGVDQGIARAGETLRLPPAPAEIGLRPLLSAGARETYQVTDLRGRVVVLTEQPQYAFYETGGAELDRDTAYEPLDGVAPPDGLSRIRAPAAGSGMLYVVVRDGRGGESWLSFPWASP